MQLIAYNPNQLQTAIEDMCHQFDAFGGKIALSYDKPEKEKTKKQLGFFFGALVKSIQLFFKDQGENYSTENIKENFYQAVSYQDDTFKKQGRRFNGETYITPKRLSEMSLEEASLFIDKCLYLVDNAACFKGLVLHPSIRYTWVRKIQSEEIYNLKDVTLPRLDPVYLEHQRKQACICCGKTHQSQAHHLKLPDLSAMAFKSPDWCAVPLCHECHINQLHQKGQSDLLKGLAWITKHISLIDFCKINYLRWKNKN